MTIIRKVVGDTHQNHATVSDEWTLRPQIEALESWLVEHHHELDPSSHWIADVGFTTRPTASGGGPPLTRTLMQLCLAVNMEIYLSEYPADR